MIWCQIDNNSKIQIQIKNKNVEQKKQPEEYRIVLNFIIKKINLNESTISIPAIATNFRLMKTWKIKKQQISIHFFPSLFAIIIKC